VFGLTLISRVLLECRRSPRSSKIRTCTTVENRAQFVMHQKAECPLRVGRNFAPQVAGANSLLWGHRTCGWVGKIWRAGESEGVQRRSRADGSIELAATRAAITQKCSRASDKIAARGRTILCECWLSIPGPLARLLPRKRLLGACPPELPAGQLGPNPSTRSGAA
jgi:hypothetical protein